MAFAGGLSTVGDLPGFDYYSYNAFQFVFVLLQSAAFGGVFIGFSIGADFDSGLTRRLFLAARNRSAVIAGYGVAAVVRTAFVWAVVFAVALATGDEGRGRRGRPRRPRRPRPDRQPRGVPVRGRDDDPDARTLQAAPAMQLPVFFILMTAPVYVPRDLLQGWIDSVSQVNPVTAILEAGRSLIAGDPFHLILAFAAAAALAIVLSEFARRGLHKAEAAG
jgi:ABC-2 type transport system permease protein